MTRWVALDGAANVRDLGGLPTEDGGTTAAGVVLRADNLQGLTPADVATLTGRLRLRRVVDLRTGTEVRRAGPGPLVAAGVEHLHHSLFPEVGASTDAAADQVLPWQTEDRGADFPDSPSTGYYLGYLRDRPDSVAAAVAALAGPDDGGATLVHCAAGKDRTGVVVALALLVAGVRSEAVVADYVASAERIGDILARLRADPVYAEDLLGWDPASHAPRAVAMERFLDELAARHDGAEAYLRTHGVSDAALVRLRSRLRGAA